MISFNKLQKMSQRELIVAIWDLQKMEGLIAELKQQLSSQVLDYALVTIATDPPIGFILGQNDKMVDALISIIYKLVEGSGVKMEVFLADLLDQLKEKNNVPSGSDTEVN